MPLIPNIKPILLGDKVEGQKYIGFAQSQLKILLRLMSYQKLNEGIRTVSPIDGVLVTCECNFNQKKITISVVPKYNIEQVLEVSTPVLTPIDLQYIPEEENTALYFFRIKYNDPDIDTYESWLGTTYSHLNSDRLIAWELSRDSLGELISGTSVLFFDVDVITREVFFPISLTTEEKLIILNTADQYIITCPSCNVPSPTGSLEDQALADISSGGLSEQVETADKCNYLVPDEPVNYFIDDLYASQYCTMIPKYPSDLDITYYTAWETEWCGDPLQNFYGYNWFGITSASDFIGELVSAQAYTAYVTQDYILDGPWPPYDEIGWIWQVTGPVENNPEKVIDRGTWFTNKNTTEYNSFFVYSYIEKTNRQNLEQWGELIPSGDSYIPGDFYHKILYDFPSGYGGVVTPLEVITKAELISSSIYDINCSELPCAFNTFSSDFYHIYFGDAGGQYRVWNFPCPVLVEGNYPDPSVDGASRVSYSYNRRFRDRFHISTTTKNNFISLSHYEEIKGGVELKVELVNSTGTICNGVTGGEKYPLAEFGYIVYIFSPENLSWFNPITVKTEYWNIYNERQSLSLIHPNRYLDIEEYINTVVREIQTNLDADTIITKLDSVTGTAYSLNYYGFGIMDGFLNVKL